ncbi:EamA family transporter [Lederbergia citrisecunda]|uniref:EamA family transporter n=1 Tax=Lederbergia citrisecunda TaxID=2833583 RepID=UPI001F2E6955|nr:EamA family transporter [Lederbergia citrisecunda]
MANYVSYYYWGAVSTYSWNGNRKLVVHFMEHTVYFRWLVFFTLVSSGEASKVSTYTFFIPVIAILGSSLFLHEAVTINLIVGMIIVVLNIALVNLKPKKETSDGLYL